MAEPEKPLSLEELQRRIDEAKHQSGGTRDSSAGDAEQGMGKAILMGTELVAGVGVGGGVGYFLDRWLGSFPLCFIICLFLGAAAGFRNMVREASKGDKE